jgi:hypothetical protein
MLRRNPKERHINANHIRDSCLEGEMALSIPAYMSTASFSQTPIKFEWNDVSPARAFGNENISLEKKIAALSIRAITGLAAAFDEWVVFRLAGRSDSSLPLYFIEAAWAAVVDWQYIGSTNIPPRDEWRGPERGPVRAGMLLLSKVLGKAPSLGLIDYDTVCISNLAEHVLPDTGEFRKWRKAVLDRLSKLYPVNPDDKLGAPIPREAYDPTFDFKIEMTDDLVGKYIQSLDFSKNPYLTKP